MSSRRRARYWPFPRGATVVDFAYAIHSNVGNHTSAAKINNEQVPLRTELKNGDVVEIITTPHATPNPAWLGFVRTGRARSKIRNHLKTLAQTDSESLGEKLLTQALRAEGLEQLPDSSDRDPAAIWDKLLRFHRKPLPQRPDDRYWPGQTHCHHCGQTPGRADV